MRRVRSTQSVGFHHYAAWMTQPYDTYQRLCELTQSGELVAICSEHDVSLFVVFGSVLQPDGDPRDVDVAVRFDADQPDVLTFLDVLSRQLVSDDIDLMILNQAGPVARERALVKGRPLYVRRSGDFANAQIGAIMERLETDWMRRLELEQMAQ